MKISIFGLGYVGAVSAGCLAKEGHVIVGVDSVKAKVDLINGGNTPIIEDQIGDLIGEGVKKGTLKAVQSASEAVQETDISFICVGTPSQRNGNLDLSYVRKVCEDIGEELKVKEDYHVVVVRSTMLPGSMKNIVIPTLEEFSGKKAGKDFGVCINPEFLREGTAVFDFYNPPKTVIGELDSQSGDVLFELYADMEAPLVRTDLETAEMVKYTDNVWHAVKVGFANEIGSICKSCGIDSHKVMDIFCQDTKLNISPYYMRPGFAFGGSCLPKDLRALTYKAKQNDLDLPILNNVMRSNRRHIERAIEQIVGFNKQKIGILGFSFKAGTDDLRESPMVEIVEFLIGKGYDLRLYDRNVNIASLIGANKDYILNKIPHISKLMVDTIEEAVGESELLVVGNKGEEFFDAIKKLGAGKIVIDFVRITDNPAGLSNYEGICW